MCKKISVSFSEQISKPSLAPTQLSKPTSLFSLKSAAICLWIEWSSGNQICNCLLSLNASTILQILFQIEVKLMPCNPIKSKVLPPAKYRAMLSLSSTGMVPFGPTHCFNGK
jgi:hypothetical protein